MVKGDHHRRGGRPFFEKIDLVNPKVVVIQFFYCDFFLGSFFLGKVFEKSNL